MLMLLAGCRSSQTATEGTHGKTTSEVAYVEKVVANGQQSKAVTAKMNLELKAMGKDLAVNGRLRMKRDEVIQMSLSLLGFEVGRLEFSPQQVLLVDRVNKQYVRANYSDVKFLQQAGIDFNMLQSLFWNELFVPGCKNVADQLSRYRYVETGDHVTLSLLDAPKLEYTFVTQMREAIVKSVLIKGKKEVEGPKLEWNYDHFMRLDNRYFPSFMQCRVIGLDKDFGFSLSLSRLDNDEKWPSETQVSSRYKERNIEDILMQLMGM